jgi:diacylglycerol O-acyltransferase / trehalose O-mycolyltransferase
MRPQAQRGVRSRLCQEIWNLAFSLGWLVFKDFIRAATGAAEDVPGSWFGLQDRLPAGFDPSADDGWPALYLLHGAWGDQASWTGYLAPLEDEDVIVVMPDGGTVGWYSDWYNRGAGGPPGWETFHLVELRSILERCYRADGRYAVAGLSMGGFGALSYAARHPDLFVAAASYSGAVHTRAGEPVAPLVLTGLNGIESGSPDGVWGNFLLDEVRWRGGMT